jgi:hypothetical protein
MLMDCYEALNAATCCGTAVSAEAEAIQASLRAVMEAMEQSFVLFGAKAAAISNVREVVISHAERGWDGDDGLAVSPIAALLTEAFIRALPSDVAMPEISPEPDGALSLDWIQSRSRVFTISIGLTDQLPYAWIDGTDRGHGVARFDFRTIPARILDGIRRLSPPSDPCWSEDRGEA